MMTAEVKFSPRYAKVFIRTKRLYMLDEDLEIIDLTTNVGTGSNTSTPFSTPQKKHKLDCDELDSLYATAALAPCQCTLRSCTLRASHNDSR